MFKNNLNDKKLKDVNGGVFNYADSTFCINCLGNYQSQRKRPIPACVTYNGQTYRGADLRVCQKCNKETLWVSVRTNKYIMTDYGPKTVDDILSNKKDYIKKIVE